MEKRNYVAYGSNLNIGQMAVRCPTARIVGTAELKDYRLMFKGSMTGSYLTVEPEKGCSVPVAVWSVTKADERALDRYEGFPAFYYKKEIELPVSGIQSGKAIKKPVFVYIMHEERNFGIPSEYYIRTCEEGYRYFGFDVCTLYDAVTYSAAKRMEVLI